MWKELLKDSRVLTHESLASYTYTETGGPADVLIFPKTVEDLAVVVKKCREDAIPLTVLGNASNVIIRDGGIRGVVIMLNEMEAIRKEGSLVMAQAGAKLVDVSRYAADLSLTGLEFACGIPGSVGGAAFMNAGAYGGEMKDVVQSVTVMDKTGEVKVLTSKELDFSYRHSSLQESRDLVLEVVFNLRVGEAGAIEAKMQELTHLRESKQPLEYPSCGSVFKRPEGHYTGQLIQEAGLQGYRIGGVEVSKKHAGFMVNVDHGTASDYMRLIRHVQEVIKERFNVSLETEVRIIGEASSEESICDC
ncbi:UDP-N-acetylmuramate dehydrogenase [Atopobacter sp. AH10]|uniref:UDP-N-acetylmuramate dehydrogenase n=1 Tax=Atopobacter sp. AH10 TaxID=2315861 RepID=UPI000EF1CE66|nr:UDP-N-acetylmuramate dehydrogenase [Atopobacter sp. AH10]RLK63890.1 UDP-N-acetylmuramate dehydrogenase [Atopobacter sp. AH10]